MGKQNSLPSVQQLMYKSHQDRLREDQEEQQKLRDIAYKSIMHNVSFTWQLMQSENMRDRIDERGFGLPCTCGTHAYPMINKIHHTHDALIYIREIKCGTCCTKPRLFLELTPNGESAKRNDPVFKDVLERILHDWNRKGKRF